MARPAIGDPPGMVGVAFADPASWARVALPFYRLTVDTRGRGRIRIDVEAYLLRHALPRHACLLVERPEGGVDELSLPVGVRRAEPFTDAWGVLAHMRRLLERLEAEAEEAPGVREAGRSIAGLIARLFGAGRPPRLGGRAAEAVETRLAYTLCVDVFGPGLLGDASLAGWSLVYRVYRVAVVEGEVWVAGERGRDRRVMKVVEESRGAREALLRLAGLAGGRAATS